MLPQLAEGTAAKLAALKESTDSDTVKRVCDEKLAANAEKLAKYADPAAAYAKAAACFNTLLDELDKALDGPELAEGKPRFIAGEAFSLADIVVGALLARAHWATEPREALLGRPRCAAYWAAVSSRPEFEKADVWTTLKPVTAMLMIGEAAVDSARVLFGIAHAKVAPGATSAWHAVADPVAGAARTAGSAVNEHVLRPVADSAPYKAASLVVTVQVMPKLREAANTTGDFLSEKVITPVKAGSERAGQMFNDAAEATKSAAGQAAEATRAAAERAAEATKHAAERAAEATKQAAEATKQAAEKAAEATKHAAEKAAEHAKHAADKISTSSPKAGEEKHKKEEQKKEEEEAK